MKSNRGEEEKIIKKEAQIEKKTHESGEVCDEEAKLKSKTESYENFLAQVLWKNRVKREQKVKILR